MISSPYPLLFPWIPVFSISTPDFLDKKRMPQ